MKDLGSKENYVKKFKNDIDENGIISLGNPMPSRSAKHFRTTILKVGSNGEIVREIKRILQLNS